LQVLHAITFSFLTPKSYPNAVLVAPLNWGLGHATRCIPIIRALQENHHTPIIASDGEALALLKKEFPSLLCLELPSYQIEYPEDATKFRWKMMQQLPKILEALLAEKKMVKGWVNKYNLCGIISDNRLGVRSKKVPSVFITHQLRVLTGSTTWFSSSLHQNFIQKFDEVWIPDFADELNLSGKMGHLKNPEPNHKYIGPLSRFTKKELPKKYDLLVLLSGPEPHRGKIEIQLREMLSNYKGKLLFVSGKIEDEQKKFSLNSHTYMNFMTSTQVEQAMQESNMVLCRSGYSTVMDLVALNKKAFLIPTPGQFEQEYLAKRLKKAGFFPYAKQSQFTLEHLLEVDLYKTPFSGEKIQNWKNLLCLFDRE
jgi:uncharacterized protein (TIGR00661 family)